MTQLQFPEPAQGTVSAAAGEAAKADGMARAAASTAPDWATACQNGIALLAKRGIPFQAADLIREGLVDEPEHPAMWGPQFGIAARAGVIEHAGVVASARATVHRSLCRQWIGTTAYRTEAA
jgi:predicted Zn-dependent protease